MLTEHSGYLIVFIKIIARDNSIIVGYWTAPNKFYVLETMERAFCTCPDSTVICHSNPSSRQSMPMCTFLHQYNNLPHSLPFISMIKGGDIVMENVATGVRTMEI